jgi:hypothetical protein
VHEDSAVCDSPAGLSNSPHYYRTTTWNSRVLPCTPQRRHGRKWMLDPRHLQDLSLLSPKTAVLQSLKNLAVNHLHIGVVSSFTQPMMLCSFHLRLRSLFFPATHSTGALHPHISRVGRCVQSARSCRGTERTIPFSLVFLIFRSFKHTFTTFH